MLGYGEISTDSLVAIVREVCELPVEPDAVIYDPESIRIAGIRPEDAYGGRRVVLRASLGLARLPVKVDVGLGDSVTPEAEWLDYPSLIDSPSPRLRAYPREVVVAEKLHAMVVLGSKNSRMRDFYDVHSLAGRCGFSDDRLTQAIRATFQRRRTPIPDALPLALTPTFAEAQPLEAVLDDIAAFLGPVMTAARSGEDVQRTWPPGGPWRAATKA